MAAAGWLTGARIRARRERIGLRQAEVARRAGISASYLNLIEHDRRRVGPDLLPRLAAALEIEAEALAGAQGRTDDLRAAAAAAGGAAAELARAEDFAGRFPGWADLVLAQAARIARLERLVEALNDRIGQDPHLSAALHEVLNAMTSVRAAAGILAETDDLDPDWRRRFHQNLHTDSERLAAGAEALVAYLDQAEGSEANAMAASPQEEVEDWLALRGWHLPDLEPGGGGPAALSAQIAGLASDAARSLARDWVAVLAADAAAMPEPALGQALADAGGDPLRIAARLGVAPLAAMRRTALRAGATEGLVLCDAAGAFLLRKPVAGFPLPRGGGGCALWPLYAALGQPGTAVEGIGELPGQVPRRFRLRAIAEIRHPGGFGGPVLRQAAMLIRADDLPAGVTPLRIGGACRICPRALCPARREPPILRDEGL